MIPLLIAGAASAIGGGVAHYKASKKNEEANAILFQAKKLYENEKNILAETENKAKSAMVSLGNSKKHVLATSMVRFLRGWERIKDIQLTESEALSEIRDFSFSKNEILEISNMVNIYESSLKSGGSGALSGGIAAIAAGSLSVPVVAVFAAAPALLFSGLNANKKANENYENALVTKYKAEEAVEKMKTSETMYNAITKRSDMFENLLLELDLLFAKCAYSIDRLTKKKYRKIRKEKTKIENLFTEDEIKLLAVTRSLAGAVKSVLDTPILSSGGKLSNAWDKEYRKIESSVTSFETEVKAIEQKGIVVKVAPKISRAESMDSASLAKEIVRNIFALILSFSGSGIFNYFLNGQKFDFSTTSLFYTGLVLNVSLLFFLKSNNAYKLFRFIRGMSCLAFSALATLGMLGISEAFTPIKFWWDLGFGVMALIAFGLSVSFLEKHKSNIGRITVKITGFAFLATVAYLLAGSSTVKWPGFISVTYFLFSMVASFLGEDWISDSGENGK